MPRWLVYGESLIDSQGRCNSCSQFRGGRLTSQGYRMIPIGGGKVIGKHRFEMEKALGRTLQKDETVHHKPGYCREDSRIGGLELRVSTRHPRGWSVREMRDYVLSVPKKLGGLK